MTVSIGVLSSNGTTMSYLDKIGGTGNDRIFDIVNYGNNLYWTELLQMVSQINKCV